MLVCAHDANIYLCLLLFAHICSCLLQVLVVAQIWSNHQRWLLLHKLHPHCLYLLICIHSCSYCSYLLMLLIFAQIAIFCPNCYILLKLLIFAHIACICSDSLILIIYAHISSCCSHLLILFIFAHIAGVCSYLPALLILANICLCVLIWLVLAPLCSSC